MPEIMLTLPGPIDWPLLNKQWAALGRVQEELVSTNPHEELLGGLWEFIGTLISSNEPPEDEHEPHDILCDNCGEQIDQCLDDECNQDDHHCADQYCQNDECQAVKAEEEEEFDHLKNLVNPPQRPPQSADSEVAILLERLLNWCQYIGGSEANVWKDVSDLHHKLTGRRIDV